jgi:Ca-activated chloride channel family protein
MRRVAALAVATAAALYGCKSREEPARQPGAATRQPAERKPAGPEVVVRMVYGSEKQAWLEESLRAFAATAPRTSSGAPIRIEAKAMGSGEAMQGILAGELRPHVYSPASGAYVTLLNRAWLSRAGNTRPISPQGDPLVLSPVVIAMWKPMAEALGWPKKALGWRDILRIGAERRGWAAHGRPEWGDFKLGHTNPEFSNSGLLSVLAQAYAGAGKARDLTPKDLAAKPVRDMVAKVAASVVHYGKSTGFFADKMLQRGPAYLSAAVLYENLVIESYAKKTDAPFPLVAIYPVEGTFWSDHPYAVLDAEWVGATEREAAAALLSFLKERPQQERALAHGFRPADPAVPIGAPVDAEHGVDPKQPQNLLAVPDGATLEALLALWREHKKAADVILAFDTSGSMAGAPLAAAKRGADAFLDALSDRDRVTLLFFNHKTQPPVGPVLLGGGGREGLKQRIDGVVADGGTALYETTAAARDMALQRAHEDRSRIHAVVVMTDGRDEHSKMTLPELEQALHVEGEAAPVKVFTIAYGQKADEKALGRIAEAAQGTSVRGATETIVQTYRDMAAFF